MRLTLLAHVFVQLGAALGHLGVSVPSIDGGNFEVRLHVLHRVGHIVACFGQVVAETV